MLRMLNDPDTRFSAAPEGATTYAGFMADIGGARAFVGELKRGAGSAEQRRTRISISEPLWAASRAILPPRSVYFAALPRTLPSACVSRVGSPSTARMGTDYTLSSESNRRFERR